MIRQKRSKKEKDKRLPSSLGEAAGFLLSVVAASWQVIEPLVGQMLGSNVSSRWTLWGLALYISLTQEIDSGLAYFPIPPQSPPNVLNPGLQLPG